MKKVVCLVCAIIIGLVGSIACAEDIQPFYLEAQQALVMLSISSSGTATCSGQVTAKHSNTSTDITLTLKRSSDGKTWSTAKSWSNSGSGLSGASVDKTYTVSQGYQYKLTVSGKIYDKSGKLLETLNKTSSVKSY